MRPRMRQNQIRRDRASPRRTQSNPNPADAARSKLSLAERPNSFSSARSFLSSDSGVSPFRGTSPTTAFTKFGDPGGQFTGDVCHSEDLRIGWSEKFCSRAIASKMICRESPRLEPSATTASAECGVRSAESVAGWPAFSFRTPNPEFRIHFSPSTSCMV